MLQQKSLHFCIINKYEQIVLDAIACLKNKKLGILFFKQKLPSIVNVMLEKRWYRCFSSTIWGLFGIIL